MHADIQTHPHFNAIVNCNFILSYVYYSEATTRNNFLGQL